jgi:uncharacterized protein DUF4209
MEVSELLITEESLRNAIAERIHALQEWRRCDAYFVPFRKRADELIEQNRNDEASAFRLLSWICSLNLKLDDPNEPFKPAVPWLDQLSDDQINAVSSIAPEVGDPELKARLCDLCWDQRRTFQLALQAVPAYLDSGRRILESAMSLYWDQRFERALQLAYCLRNDDLKKSVAEEIQKVVFEPSQPPHVVARAIELMLDYKLEMTKEIGDRARSFATSSEATLIWEQQFFDLAARCYRRAGHEEDALGASKNHAESFVRQAAEALNRAHGGAMVAAHFVENAIQAYRQIPGTETRRDELHRLLLSYQKRIPQEMFPGHDAEIDVSDLVCQAREAVAGQTLEKAIEVLALSGRVPCKAQLRKAATESIEEFPLQSLFPATMISGAGKTIARHGPASHVDGTPDEEVIVMRMFSEARIHHHVAVVGRIEPMRLRILQVHPVRTRNFVHYVRFNPLIPPGREYLFARGLCAGLQGDFVASLHILIPQLENSIRYVLEGDDKFTSSLSSSGIQMELSLDKLFESNERHLNDIFGEDSVFDLRGLLFDQKSSNFRNLLAHGLLYPESFQSPTAIYIWWLVLRLVVIGRILERRNRGDSAAIE